MATEPTPTSPFDLEVTDRVLAALVARSAAQTPGVRRLQTGPVHAARRALGGAVAGAVASAAARVGRDAPAGTRPSADPAAVSVEHDGSSTTATVEVVLDASRPVLDTVRDLHRRASDELRTIAGSEAVVCVLVVDLVTDARGTRSSDEATDRGR